jgi:hypothetical protein
MNTLIPVIVIDSNANFRSKPLLDVLEISGHFTLVKLKATMINGLDNEMLCKIEYSNENMQRVNRRNFFPGEIGCAHSHNLARRMAEEYPDGAIILEDDARISNPDGLAEHINKFKSEVRDGFAVLSLIDFLTVGNTSKTNGGQSTLFLKLWGKPPLAVAYFLTSAAAQSLRSANTPIRFVADWPEVKINYYVSNFSYVTHGDELSSSLIDKTLPFGEGFKRNSKKSFVNYIESLWKSKNLFTAYSRIENSFVYRFDKLRILLRFRFLS